MAKKKKIPMTKMQCEVCKEVNYYTHKTRNTEGKLNLKKHCSHCRKHTLHKEMKK